MAIFTGAGVALVTPMNQDGSVNYDKLKEADRAADRGTYRCDHYLRYNRRSFYSYGGRAYRVYPLLLRSSK